MDIPLALAGGAFIFLAFIIVFFLAVVYSFYTRKGSGINQRPSDGRGEAQGAKGESHMTTTEDSVEKTVGSHGTK